MADFLVSQPAVVLQDVVVVRSGGDSDFLRDGLSKYKEGVSEFIGPFAGLTQAQVTFWTYQELSQAVVGDVCQLLAVVLRDDELRWWWWSVMGVNQRGAFNNKTTYGMTLAQRLDVHEGQGLVALEKLEGGDLSCETTGHTMLAGRAIRVLVGSVHPSSPDGPERTVRVQAGRREDELCLLCGRYAPLMILQKIQLAILLAMKKQQETITRVEFWSGVRM